MFADRRVTAMIPVKDMDRAKNWYADKLGIKPTSERPDVGATYELGGGTIAFMYPTNYAGTAEHTIVAFECNDLVADMAQLRDKGVVFLDYDMPGLKTENGMADLGADKAAWAKDSEGNILGFVQMSG